MDRKKKKYRDVTAHTTILWVACGVCVCVSTCVCVCVFCNDVQCHRIRESSDVCVCTFDIHAGLPDSINDARTLSLSLDLESCRSLAAAWAIFFSPCFILSSSFDMKQQAEHSIKPDTSHKFRKDETAILRVSPEDFIQISMSDGPAVMWCGCKGIGRYCDELEMMRGN